MPRKLGYFVTAAWRATLVTALLGLCVLAGTLLLVWLMADPDYPFVESLPRTMRAIVYFLPALWLLIFVLEFGNRRVGRRRRGRARDER